MMAGSLIARFRTRSRSERRLLLRTATLFLCAHVLSHRRELERARAGMAKAARHLHATAEHAAQLAWAIAAIDRRLPGYHSCLVHALACEAIAANSNIPVEFKIGAAHQHGRMHFHAWVEHQGAALTGAHDGEFTTLR